MLNNKEILIQEDEINLKELLNIIKKNIKKILFFVFFITTLTLVYVLSLANEYKSEIILSSIGDSNKSVGSNLSSLAALAGVNLNQKSSGIDPYLMMKTTLNSYDFNKHIIEKYDLSKKLKENKNLVFTWGIDFFYNLFHSNNTKEIENEEEKIFNTYKKLSNIISLNSDKKTNLIHLSATLKDRYLANDLVNIYLKEIIANVKINDLKDLDKQISFYKNELNSVKDVATKEQLSSSLSSLLQKRVFSKANEYYFVTKLTNSRVAYIKEKVKPKRALILIVSFITSFILGIFLLFFIKFIKNENN